MNILNEELINEEVKVKKGRPRQIKTEVEEPIVKLKRGPKPKNKPEDIEPKLPKQWDDLKKNHQLNHEFQRK